MQGITDNVRQDIIRFVPSSVVDEIACFLLYEKHPREEKLIDIVVCTKNGDVKEFFQRDMIHNIALKTSSAPTKILLLRNSASSSFYVVSTADELFLIPRFEYGTQENVIISNVESFTVEDLDCKGKISLKVYKKDDAVPIIFDENMDIKHVCSKETCSTHVPLIHDLKQKYIAAQYNVLQYQQTLSDATKVRHETAMQAFLSIHPNHGDSHFKTTFEIYQTLNFKTEKPWVKVCNRKLVVALKAINENTEPLKDVHIVCNSAIRDRLTYTTKLFDTKTPSELVKEKDSNQILPKEEVTIVAILNLDEVKSNVTSRIILNGSVCYKFMNDTYTIPFEDVLISSLDTLGDEMDVLSSDECNTDSMIAILSTTVKTDLLFRNIRGDGEMLKELLIKHLQMVQVSPNVIVYKKSPYHALNGVMLNFHGHTDKAVTVSVYTNTKSQVLALIKFINDTVPTKYIITTPNYIITAKTPELEQFTEQKPEIPEPNMSGYAKTVLNRTGKILEYLDLAMQKMGESKNPEIVNKVGFQIDIYAAGEVAYKELRQNIMEEGKKGVKFLINENGANDLEPMVVENEPGIVEPMNIE